MRLILYTSFLLLAALSATGFGPLFRGGAGGAAAPTGILLPLSGSSLVTTNSGTLTFANWQTEKGWELKSNGSDLNVPATSVCNADIVAGSLACVSGAGVGTYAKYNTQLPSPWPAQQCLVDGYTVLNTLTGNIGTFTTPDGAVWTWGAIVGGGPDYNVNRNGVFVAQGRTLTEMTDGSVATFNSGLHAWFVYEPVNGAFLGWGTAALTVAPNGSLTGGKWRKAVACPSGLS